MMVDFRLRENKMWQEYSLFLAQTITLVIAILVVIGGAILIVSKSKQMQLDNISIKHLNEKYKRLRANLQEAILGKKALKSEKKSQKEKEKAYEKNKDTIRKIFVVNFHGDVKASKAHNLRHEITAILTAATPKDEVVVNIESSGGMVHAYGFAASQLQRVRDRGIPLTVTIDKVAASGGYMMACVADKILSAPFAYVGSIGVIVQFPNFHRLLKDKHIDFEQIKAGDYKRNVTIFGENTDADRARAQDDVNEVHVQFKDFINRYRSQVDIEQVATGEVWLGTRAKEFNLVDEIMTSDDYLLKASESADIFEISYQGKKSMTEKMFSSVKTTIFDPLLALIMRNDSSHIGL